MQNKFINLHLLAILGTFLLSACTAHVDIDWKTRPVESLDRETADLADVTTDALALADSNGPENVLMVFDIDNTILAMEQGLGADQWYEWQKDLANHDQCNPQNVGNRFAVQGALLFASAMRPTQNDAASQVATIQARGVPVIVVTSRGHDYRLQTFRELRRNGYNFTYSAIGPEGGYDQPFIPVEDGLMSRYEDGVFMTAGQHKGKMLSALLQKTRTELPDVIVIADDKQKNLDAIKETFSALDVPVRAWRYSAEDENVASFDTAKANAEWESIEAALRQIQQVLGPDNYNLDTAALPDECL
jgi:hypothetical protein